MSQRRLVPFLFALAVYLIPTGLYAQSYDPLLYAGLKWRLIGPFRAGRSLAVTGVPGKPEEFYFGGVGGGVWKSRNAGRTWFPIFDHEPVASIGAIAVAPSNPKVIYVGTGEADMRSDIQQGDGMYKSTDAGRTWVRIGLSDTRAIAKIIVDPTDPNTVYVAALGHPYAPNAERGVFKTTDGGRSWSKILYHGPNVGAIDLSMDPTNSNVIFAALWQTRRPPWNTYPPSNGPGSGLYRTADGGATWTQVSGNGFPGFVGRVGVSIAPSDPNRVYAIVDTNDEKTGGLYRSDDGGSNWKLADADNRIWTRGWYFCGVTTDPLNADTVYVMNTSTYRSTNAGKSFIPIKGAPGGDDYHTLWIYPTDANRMIVGSDQGVVISVDGAKTWSSWYNQPTGQFYHAITDSRFPYWVYGSQQDSGAMGVPSRTIHTGISMHDWRPLSVGGESGTIAPDPLHPGVLLGNNGSRERLSDGFTEHSDPTMADPKTVWRNTWTLPIVASPTQPNVFYTSHQKVLRTGNDGKSWQVISPDLSRKADSVPSTLDAATIADNDGNVRRGVVYWIAPSPIAKHEIWAGTDDGLIWLTRDEGAHWKNVTPRGLTPWSKVAVIDASPFDENTAYAAVDRHRLNDDAPYIFRTHDGGFRWTKITNGIPRNRFVNVVRADPVRPGLLYAGTDEGVYVSFDDGGHWQSLQQNLPPASIRDITFRDGDIVIATHGRAFWILDDASPLRQLTRKIADAPAALFKPASAILFQRAPGFGGGTSDEGTPLPPEEPQGQNPPWGAYIDYTLANGSSPVVLTFMDSSGKLVRRISSADKPLPMNFRRMDIPSYWFKPPQRLSGGRGEHRYIWNLHYLSDRGPVVPPGGYTVRLTVDGKTYSQLLEVVKDPRSTATIAGLRGQFALANQVNALLRRVQAATQKATRELAGLDASNSKAGKLKVLLGGGPRSTPDMSMPVAGDIGSLRNIAGDLSDLMRSVESGSAPTAEQRRLFALFSKESAGAIARLGTLSK